MKFGAAILFLLSFAGACAAEVEMPPMPSPIAEFRTWLTNSADGRKVALARRSEASRKVIEAKLDEYSALSPAERERRLGALELRWYLRPLMETKPHSPERTNKLALVPVYWGPILDSRLAAWDKLSPELQKEALDHELTMQYFSSPPEAQQAVLRSLTPTDRTRLEERARAWKVLSASERMEVDSRMSRFFTMDVDRQEKVLNRFSDKDRQEMEDTLKAFRTLSPEQRAKCIDSFGKFATMSNDERVAFLRNVERWQAMSPEDRAHWRKLVNALPPFPPMPPGMGDPPVPWTGR